MNERLMQFVLEMRQQGVTHARALSAMERTPRPHYAPGYLADVAFDDTELPIGHGQMMTRPSLIGRMLAAFDPLDDDVVLEVGAGSGYQAGVLGLMARKVVTIDRWRPLIAVARAHLGTARRMNVYAHLADGFEGWPEAAPYDRIIINASVADIPEALIAQLKPGGVIVAPLERNGAQALARWRDGEIEALGPVQFAPLTRGLPDAPKPAAPETPSEAPPPTETP